MKRTFVLATSLALLGLLALGGAALADGGRKVAVKPLSPKVGEQITVVGAGLGANREIEIRLIGQNVDIDLGEVESVDDSDFEGEFMLPANLKPGIYEIKAFGDETAETQVTIQAATGASATQASAAPMASQSESVQTRPLGEAAILVAIFGVLAALGLFFAWTARHDPIRRTAAQ